MATKKDPKPSEQLSEETREALRDAYEPVGTGESGVVEGAGPSDKELGIPRPEDPEQEVSRLTMPVAPKAHDLAVESRGAIARIKGYTMPGAFTGQRKYEQMREAVVGVNATRLHPSVAQYKAEVIDYLDGRIKSQ